MRLPKLKIDIRAERLAYYGMIAAVALVVGSFAAWRILTLISPQLNNSASGTTVILRVSDYSEPISNNPPPPHPTCPGSDTRLPLPNSLADNTVPCLADNALTATTLLTGNQNNINLFRLQGQLEYK
ncbi:MAG TPA: hypothetical protein VLE93_01130 [Candidatus Saccharimonadales bacterium]|nr:hypothetical protein [Candidatus Saccharimonadales bacterium]